MNSHGTTISSCFKEQKIQGQNFSSFLIIWNILKGNLVGFFFSCEFPYLFIAAYNIEDNNGTTVHVYIINK